MTRRDYTNASGYFSPTENTAIYLADREPPQKPQQKPHQHSGVLTERDIAAMDSGRSKRTSLVEYFNSLPQETPKPTPKPKDIDLKRVRAFYSAICSIAAIVDMSIDDITITVKGDASQYKPVGKTRMIERMEERV